MANKKNKKRSSSTQKEATNKLHHSNHAAEIAFKNNLDRISGALLLGKELNPKNNLKFPCVICNKSVQKNPKMPLPVTTVINGVIGNVMPCLLKCTNTMSIIKTIRE